MLEPSLDRQRGILVVEISGPLSVADIERISALLDPYLADAGRLRGMLVDARRHPGWSDIEAILSHERFLRDHAPLIDRIALVTDSDLVAVLTRFATLGRCPALRRFPWSEYHAARAWLEEG
ncbi:STAS/SEC14 domain-containing protein [Elioraea tepida]|jgi:hypothetical protein|uniref:STAS/SEC14 domain-containing protein n=1 Tax=Elioraea tepida TaxID=2843330 RepID=A0A975YKS8_9PROT|nr:STAS/SEC14 domain-containing protein [Elioraea tepida]QXM26080.1 STAS/SEC14 domain-containing protein [Elioraea tepida]